MATFNGHRYNNRTFPESTILRQMSSSKDVFSNSVVVSIQGKTGKGKEGINLLTELEARSNKLLILGVSLDTLSKSGQFCVCCGGVFVFYLIYGYVQEWIFSVKGFKPFGWYLTLVQFFFYGIFGTIEQSFHMDKRRKIPLKMYAGLAFLTVATMGLSNTSLGYLNYPTQVIFKCCKLIPVMLGGVIIQGKRYGVIDVAACLLMSIGLILFTLADSKVQPEFNPTGIVLISLALCADAVIGNVQEKTMKSYGGSNTEMVLYSYGLGFVYILCGLTITGGLWPAFDFCAQQPVKTYGLAFLFSVSGYLGITFVLTLVRCFGALLAVTVTTCRKAVTMVLSFLFFTKPFTSQYVWSGLIVLLGIFLNVYSKNQAQMNCWCYERWKQFSSHFHRRRRPVYMENI